jgi:hypothetical protein
MFRTFYGISDKLIRLDFDVFLKDFLDHDIEDFRNRFNLLLRDDNDYWVFNRFQKPIKELGPRIFADLLYYCDLDQKMFR